MIDLHTHTTESDGTVSPHDLLHMSADMKLEALAITDHDTLSGFDEARSLAREMGVRLICGIEMSTKHRGRTTHLLGYFPQEEPHADFREWIVELQTSRHCRNESMLAALKINGIDLSFESMGLRDGRQLGRPTIAAAMVKQGYVDNLQQAFDEYLDQSASCYVDREEPTLAEAMEQVHRGGGIASLAHPHRVTRSAAELYSLVCELHALGLQALEAYHSDNSPHDTETYLKLANDLGMKVTGGSDFHGANKPEGELGTGKQGNLNVPLSVLQNLFAFQ